MRLCGSLGITWSIFLVLGSMTPHFDCIVKPDSLSNRNSLHYLYEGVSGSSTLQETYCMNCEQLVEEKTVLERFGFNDKCCI